VRGVRDTRHALALAPCSESRARGSSRVLACAHQPLSDVAAFVMDHCRARQ
jgi:hypothetical protein